MKMFLKHLSVLAFLLVSCFALSGCISHWFEDSTTRLQIENRTGADIIEIDIVSEDERSVRPWIQDTIKDSSVSRVYEEDWVGDFKGRILYTNFVYPCSCVLTRFEASKSDESAASDSFTTWPEPTEKICNCTDSRIEKGWFDISLSGGSLYLVFTRNPDGTLHFESR
jgi:hypothetical protein